MEEGLGRSPPQREEIAGKVRSLLTWQRSFCKIPTTRVYRTYSERCWTLFNQEAANVDMNTNSPVNINIASPENNRFSGIIDDVAIFNVALEEEDIQTLMDTGLKETISPSAVDLSGKLVTTWANIKKK